MKAQTSKPRLEYFQAEELLQTLPGPHEQFHCQATLDPYQDCSFGCAYCPVLRTDPHPRQKDFPCRIAIKTNAPHLLHKEIKQEKAGSVATAEAARHILVGAHSDPYQFLEKDHGLTRQCLEELIAARQPFQIMTKSDLILRDLDILRQPSQEGLLTVTVSFSTMRKEVHEVLEPRVISIRRRLLLLRRLSSEGFHVGVALMPIIPYLTDRPKELLSLVRHVKKAGAQYLIPGVLSLPTPEIFDRVVTFLEILMPHIRSRYQELYQQQAFPPADYQDRILQTVLKICRRYELPAHLPIEGSLAPNIGMAIEDLW